jgi:pimeloyl-ACP methyl ester carboxylesterase
MRGQLALAKLLSCDRLAVHGERFGHRTGLPSVASRSSSLAGGDQLGVCVTAAKGWRLLGGVMLVAVRGVKGRNGSSLAILTVALAVAGCGGDSESGASGQAESATTAAPATSTTWKPGTSGSMEVTATVTGRKLVGQCTGLNAEAPTVLLEVGMGSRREALGVVEQHLGQRTRVCSYDRAGKGASTSVSTPRPVAEVISDTHAFLAQAAAQGAEPPYFLVGHSFGGEVVFRYAQLYPDQVAGFVSINPSPPYKTWVKRAATVQTPAELREYELLWFRGDNHEGIDTRSDERMLTDPLPADLPYVVMFDEVCDGLPPPLQNQQDCSRMLSILELTAKDLAKVGKGGRYVRVKGAGHDIHVTDPDVVLATVDQVWKAALGR